jgi:germination protein M
MFLSRRLTWKLAMGTLVLALVFLFVAAGCSKQDIQKESVNNKTKVEDIDTNDSTSNEAPADKTEATKPTENNDSKTKPVPKPDTGTEQAVTKLKLTLYFSDNEASYLVPEVREVEVRGKRTAEAVINELIKGPQNPNLSRTIPQETKLRTIKVESGVVYVDFSKEFQTKHCGGSAGEAMTLYSITNSLAELPGVQKVQFLLEGKKVDAILGHTNITSPLAPNWNLVKK